MLSAKCHGVRRFSRRRRESLDRSLDLGGLPASRAAVPPCQAAAAGAAALSCLSRDWPLDGRGHVYLVPAARKRPGHTARPPGEKPLPCASSLRPKAYSWKCPRYCSGIRSKRSVPLQRASVSARHPRAWPGAPVPRAVVVGDRSVPYCWTRSWSEAPGRKRSDAAAVTQRVMSRIPPIGKDECLCKQRLEMKNVCRKKATGGGDDRGSGKPGRGGTGSAAV